MRFLALLLVVSGLYAAEPVTAYFPAFTAAEDAGDLAVPFTIAHALDDGGNDRVVAIVASIVGTVVPAVEILGVVRTASDAGVVHLRTLPDRNGSSLLVLNIVTVDGLVAGVLFSVELTAVDDAPALAADQALAVGTLGTGIYGPVQLLLTDADGPPTDQLRYTVLTPPVHGALRLGGVPLVAGAVFTQAQVDAGVLSYRNLDGLSDQWSFTWDDGAGRPARGPAWADVTVAGKARPVVVLAPGGTWVEGAAALRFAADATLEDGDSASLAGGQVVAAIVSTSTPQSVYDRLTIVPTGSGATRIAVTGAAAGTVSYGGVAIGTWSGGSMANEPLVVQLAGAAATPAAVQALVRALGFANTWSDPTALTRTIQVVVDDGDAGASAPAAIAVGVQPVDSPPVIDHSLRITTYEGVECTVTASVSDLDSTVFAWSVAAQPDLADITVADAAAGIFRITPHAGVSGTGWCTLAVTADGATATRAFQVNVVGRHDPHLVPLADPPREAVAGETLHWTCPLQGEADFFGDLIAIAVGDVPAGLLVATDSFSNVSITWQVPTDEPVGAHRRFRILVYDQGQGVALPLAGVIPCSLRVLPRPAGGG